MSIFETLIDFYLKYYWFLYVLIQMAHSMQKLFQPFNNADRRSKVAEVVAWEHITSEQQDVKQDLEKKYVATSHKMMGRHHIRPVFGEKDNSARSED